MKNKLIALTLAGSIIMCSSSCFVLVRGKKPHRRGKVVIVSQKENLPGDSLLQVHPGMLYQPLPGETSAMNNK